MPALAPTANEVRHRNKKTRWAPSWQGFSSRLQADRCSHVFGLLARHTRPLAIMPSADQVPVQSPHSTMHWHMWVVLIAGSAGSALRAVRPPNLHIAPDLGAIFSRRKCDGFFVAITPGHHGPRHSCNLVGERDRSDLGGPSRQQGRKPGPMFG